MYNLFLRIYDYFHNHHKALLALFLGLFATIVVLCLRVDYREDISDFLSLDPRHRYALAAFENISGADRIVVLIQAKDTLQRDPDVLATAVEDFVDAVALADSTGEIVSILSQADLTMVRTLSSFVYENIPYFLDDDDYARMDSLLSSPEHIAAALDGVREQLLLPSSAVTAQFVAHDPLNLFAPCVGALATAGGGAAVNYELYDGYIFSPDLSTALVLVTTPYGGSETQQNGKLVEMLRRCADEVEARSGEVQITMTGAPVIAVGNARQIKRDSIFALALAGVLIFSLLLGRFRRGKELLLIAGTILWGWLFGLAALSLCHSEISIIVLGISSVVVGIAANYPLHYLSHLRHTPSRRQALRELLPPLLVGNISTVGAFLTLVPLRAPALRDLGLFSAFMLIGTVLFVIIFLPHITGKGAAVTAHEAERAPLPVPRTRPFVVPAIVVLTIILGYLGLQTKFDSNLMNINFMPQEQKEILSALATMRTADENVSYILSQGRDIDEALTAATSVATTLAAQSKEQGTYTYTSCTRFLPAQEQQRQRLARWDTFCEQHKEVLTQFLPAAAEEKGFAKTAFAPFYNVLATDYSPQPYTFFAPLAEGLFRGFITAPSTDDGEYSILTTVHMPATEQPLLLADDDSYIFDATTLNSALSSSLANDFNYIGLAAIVIVFLFLVVSFASIEVGTLAFIPMAVSWLWILGIMHLGGIAFNIVNIILATFIFGQGDDYSIFMTEGLSYEYTYQRRILTAYKRAIRLSGLIMFIGMGVLITAQHPALRSLGQVTIIGMATVVVMSYFLPPIMFRWLTQQTATTKRRPLSLRPLLVMAYCTVVFFAQLATVYLYGSILFAFRKTPAPQRQRAFRRYIRHLFAFDLRHIYGVAIDVDNSAQETFQQPAIIVANHQSLLDSALFFALSERIIIVANTHVSGNRIIRNIFRWMGNIAVDSNGQEHWQQQIAQAKEQGNSIVLFPEGQRNDNSSILRFHKGPFLIAQQLDMPLLPIIIHGANNSIPRGTRGVFPGTITVKIEQRTTISTLTDDGDYRAATRAMHHFFIDKYATLRGQKETWQYFLPLVKDCYRYKETAVWIAVTHALREIKKHPERIEQYLDKKEITLTTIHNGKNDYGATALLLALTLPTATIHLHVPDADTRALLTTLPLPSHLLPPAE